MTLLILRQTLSYSYFDKETGMQAFDQPVYGVKFAVVALNKSI